MLSCYTTNLIGHLWPGDPRIEERFAAAVDLSVRTDLPDQALAFSHHGRVDPEMGYRSAGNWNAALAALEGEFARHGDVLAVANCRNLSWSPSWNCQDIPHWVRLADRKVGRWLLIDGFDALLPRGRQQPYGAWVEDAELRELLTPLPPLPAEVHLRDVYALGAAVHVPPPHEYRWLEHGAGRAAPEEGEWVRGTAAALPYLAERFSKDPEALRRHTEDLWAAGRHHQFRHAANERAVAAWTGLAQSVQFAVQSAERGRARPALLIRAFELVIATTCAATAAVL